MLSLLTAQQKATSTTAALSYLGRTATIKSDAATLSGGGASWTYSLAAGAAATTLNVLDSSGRTVFSTNGSSKAGDTAFSWDGRMSNGAQAPNGTYRLAVKATDGAGAAITSAVSVSEKITGVDLSGVDPSVTTATGKRAMADIIAVRE